MEPLNAFEWLIEPFYESGQRELEWSAEAIGGSQPPELKPQWQALAVAWENAEPGAVAARIVRPYDLDLLESDRLCLRVSLAEDCRLTLRATVDGAEQTVVDGAAGGNVFAEFEGPVSGRRLERLTIEVISETGEPGGMHLLWLIAVDSAARERVRRLAPTYDPDWPPLLADPEGELTPCLGLLVPEDGLEGIRRRAAAPEYGAAMEALRREARGFAGLRPEHAVREHLERPSGMSTGRYGRDGYPWAAPEERISADAMRVCSLVGLIEDDPAMMRIALRHLLAACHCTHWEESFMATRPGALWDHRAFCAMEWLEAAFEAVEWAGALLSPSGRYLVARAFQEKVLALVDFSLRNYPYMRTNNQGVYFATAGVLATCALGRLSAMGGEGLDRYLAILDACVAAYFLEDGGTHEGGAYHDGSCVRALRAYEAAAHFRGIEADALLPDRLREAPHYYRVMASTARPGGFLNLSDGGRPARRFEQGAVPRLARWTGDPALSGMTAALAVPEREDGELPGAAELLVHGPDDLLAGEVMPPVFEILPALGMLCSCRPTPDGPVRVQLIGAMANAGHGHEDKGSFLLEAFGEEILIDRGICFYGDARTDLLKHAMRHNMLTPDDEAGRPLRQRNPLSEPVIPKGEGDERTLDARIEAAAGWPEVVRRWRRRIRSEEPEWVEITDTAERFEDGTVSLHFQSRHPWERDGEGWVSTGARARLRLSPQWAVAESVAEEDLFDGLFAPVYRLTLRSAPGLAFELSTRLELQPV